MKLDKDVIKSVLNYVIDNQTFDLEGGKMKDMHLTTIVKNLSNGNEDKMQEISCAIIRCINEGFVYSNYPKTVWSVASISDVSMRGFIWLENNQ